MTAAADSIFDSARRLSGTCSTIAAPARHSCSKVKSSMQFRVTTSGSGGGAAALWWDIVAGDLQVLDRKPSVTTFSFVICALTDDYRFSF